MTIAERLKAKADAAKPAAAPKKAAVKNRVVDRELIVIDSKLQCRECMSEATVEEYFQVIKSGKELPPLRCVDVAGELHVVDGFTRYAALTRASKTRVNVAVSVGTMEDAVREACGANQTHGLRRTKGDIKKAVALAEATFKGLSRKAIAEIIGVHVTSIYNHTELPKKETRPKKEHAKLVPVDLDKSGPDGFAAETSDAPVGVPKKVKVAKDSTKPAKKPSKAQDAPKDELDIVQGETCLTCGGGDWALSDSGGRVCLNCQVDEAENIANASKADKIDKSKIETALGKLVREVEAVGLYGEFRDLLDAFSAKLATK